MVPLLRAFGRAVAVLSAVSVAPALAQPQQNIVPGTPAVESHKTTVARINGGRVGIISGGIGGTYLRIATDLASVLDDGDTLRILPVAGKGSVQNIIDILYLRGIDVGIVQSDVLSYLKTQPKFRDIGSRIRYITKLYNEEFHLVAAADLTSVNDLAGKKVNVGIAGSGTFMTATSVFRALGIEIEPVNVDQALALEKIKSGEIAATVYVAGKPAGAVSGLKAADGYRLLPVPYTAALQQTYLPATLSGQDYPNLIDGAQPLETIAVGAVMAVFNWRPGSVRYNRVVKFVETFFSKFAEFQKPPRHSKWQEVSLHATLPGWSRFPAAETWLAQHVPPARRHAGQQLRRVVAAQEPPPADSKMTAQQRETLFREFLRWRRQASQ